MKHARTVTICDSFAILTNGLAKLCKDFDIETSKGIFPYNFANESTLFYKGSTPDFGYYSGINRETYNSMKSQNWDFKKECLIYLDKDLKALYGVISLANHEFFLNFNLNITEVKRFELSGL